MALYIISIVGGDALIILANLLINKNTMEYTYIFLILAGILAAIGVIAIDGITAAIVRRCFPEKWFNYTVKFHEVGKKECKFYEALGIKHWKDKVIELGMFTSFSKKEIAEPANREYMERFILESNYGVWCHLVNAVAGFLIILCFPLRLTLRMTLPAALINFVLSMLPFMILRYNLPRLHRIRNILEKKEAKEATEKTENN